MDHLQPAARPGANSDQQGEGKSTLRCRFAGVFAGLALSVIAVPVMSPASVLACNPCSVDSSRCSDDGKYYYSGWQTTRSQTIGAVRGTLLVYTPYLPNTLYRYS